MHDGFRGQPSSAGPVRAPTRRTGSRGQCLSQQYTQRASAYVTTYVTLPSDAVGLAYSEVVGRTASLAAALQEGNLRVGDALAGSATNLAASAVDYRETDTAAAARLDHAYRPTGLVPLIEDPPAGEPWKDPSDALTEPSSDGPSGPIPDDLVTDILSASGNWTNVGWLGEKILELWGFNPEQWLTEKLAGNFAMVARTRNAVANLAAFDRAGRDDVETGVGDLVASWKGHAATAAQSYFTELSGALGARADRLDTIVASYDSILSTIVAARDSISTAVEAVIGKVLEITAALAAAGCLAELPTVDLVIGIVGASKVAELVGLIHDVWNLWTTIWGQITGWADAFDAASNATSEWTLGVHMPAAAYRNRSQDPGPRSPAPRHQDRREPAVTR